MPKGLGWTVEDVYALEARGEWEEALKRWRQLLTPFQDPVAAEEIRDLGSHRQIWYHIGLCERHVGKFDEALAAYDRAEKLACQAGDEDLQLSLLNSIAVVHRNAGRLDEALRRLHDALSVAESRGDPSMIATIHDNIAVAYGSQGKLEDALAEETVAYGVLQASAHGTDPEVVARVQANLRGIRMQLGLSQDG